MAGALRKALEKRREVKITIDRDCNIHAVELLPEPPFLARMGEQLGAMASRLLGR